MTKNTEQHPITPPLSPAARAVLDACKEASDGHYIGGEWIQDHAGQIAAALRTAADQVAPDDYTSFTGHLEWDTGMEARTDAIRENLLAIAAELEGSNG